MLELENISLELKPVIDPPFKAENSKSADFCFGNIYMWDERFRQSVCSVGERLITLLYRKGLPCFAFPVGSGDIRPAFRAMLDYCERQNIPFRLCGILDEHIPLIEDAYPHEFSIREDRDFSDYIYDIDKLCTYAGKKLHAKRNFCNRFEAENDWHFESFTKEHIPECTELLKVWSADRSGTSLYYEQKALIRGFEDFESLGLEGGVLYAGSKPVGFTIGELISRDTFCIHFEKAYSDIPGAYPMVCREMARMAKGLHSELRYVNREDDMGIASLRESKLSYKPEFILNKYTAVKL